MAANEFRRNRIYYTKAQINNGLLTEGEEWMFIDGTEYIGQYHTYTTGEVFSLIEFLSAFIEISSDIIIFLKPIFFLIALITLTECVAGLKLSIFE